MAIEGTSPTWEEDYERRLRPDLLTRLLREAVPALAFTRFLVIEVQEGLARGELPLSAEASNQYFTHQAAMFCLAGDYVGGVAFSTALRGVPIVGIHPRVSDADASLWLMKMEIEYRAPSTSDLLIAARLNPARLEPLRRQFSEGKAAIGRVEVTFENSEGVVIAEATMTYFAQQVAHLRPASAEQRPSTLFKHTVSASARLVAGLRAMEGRTATPLFHDELASRAAGAHGRLLAERFNNVLPQLSHMVAARTRAIDDMIRASIQDGIEQVVFIGAGLDFRLARHPEADTVTVFELDLQHMLEERERLLMSTPRLPYPRRRLVPLNLELDDLAANLIGHGLEPHRPTLFIAEGVSMYLQRGVNRRILGAARSLMQDPRSRLWVDLVAASVVSGTSGYPEVESFLGRMASIAEPFIFGLDDLGSFCADLGLAVAHLTSSGDYHPSAQHPIFGLYRFALLAPIPYP